MNELNEETRCEIVKSIKAEYDARAAFGLGKYGITLSEHNADIFKRLQHLKEELMDATLYIQWTMLKMSEQETEKQKLISDLESIQSQFNSVCQEFEPIDIESETACGNCERSIDLYKGKINFCPHCGCKIKYKPKPL